MQPPNATGPLNGIRVVELPGIGPGPMAGMLLADMGAEVWRVERPGRPDADDAPDVSFRGKKLVTLDLKATSDVDLLKRLLWTADVLIDPFRAGVCERLGLGPELCLSNNSRLIFARVTGWGQSGPLSRAAGHDINYISVAGVLHSVGPADRPPVLPLNLVADMGGGGMLAVQGILAALIARSRTGMGQVVDAAMVDGAAQLMWMFFGWHHAGRYRDDVRGSNMLGGAAPFYGCYHCRDGKYFSVGAVEDKFYARLLEVLELADDPTIARREPADWPHIRSRFEAVFAARGRDEWTAAFEGVDACVSPVLTMQEAFNYTQAWGLATFEKFDDVIQPSPAPKFSVTPSTIRRSQVVDANALAALLDQASNAPSVPLI